MNRTIDEIKNKLANEEFILSRHAFIRSIERGISMDEIREGSQNMEIIENYPNDKYSASCLVLCFTNGNRPLHIQITLDSSSTMKIITLYEPDSSNWTENYKVRI